MHEDVVACAVIVEKGDPDRFKATMAAPVAVREKLFPLYAFNVEVARAPWLTEEPMIAEMRLQWWRDALDEIRTGGSVRRHDVASALAKTIDSEGAFRLDKIVAARRWDIYKDPFEDSAHFRSYLTNTAGNLLAVAMQALKVRNDDFARQIGYVHGLANWLRAVPALEASGRIPLIDGRAETIAELAQEGLDIYRVLRRDIAKLPRHSRTVFLALWQVEVVLKQAAATPEKVADGQLESSPLRQKLGLMKSTFFGL